MRTDRQTWRIWQSLFAILRSRLKSFASHMVPEDRSHLTVSCVLPLLSLTQTWNTVLLEKLAKKFPPFYWTQEFYIAESRHFSKSHIPLQNSMGHNTSNNQVPYSAPPNISRQCTKSSRPGDMASGICESVHKSSASIFFCAKGVGADLLGKSCVFLHQTNTKTRCVVTFYCILLPPILTKS